MSRLPLTPYSLRQMKELTLRFTSHSTQDIVSCFSSRQYSRADPVVSGTGALAPRIPICTYDFMPEEGIKSHYRRISVHQSHPHSPFRVVTAYLLVLKPGTKPTELHQFTYNLDSYSKFLCNIGASIFSPQA
ncbi:hypothetical protein STEG23_030541 [Scotinomys teguina]